MKKMKIERGREGSRTSEIVAELLREGKVSRVAISNVLGHLE